MRNAAAQCELDGPRITGPMTSLKMLTGKAGFMIRLGVGFLEISASVRAVIQLG
jgi:hypothetical protein